MSMSLTSILKKAKKSLDDTDYQQASTLAEECIEQYNDNPNTKYTSLIYNAYLIHGLAKYRIREYNDSEASYQHAVQLDNSNIQAYKGLDELYTAMQEKNNNINERHIDVLNKIIS